MLLDDCLTLGVVDVGYFCLCGVPEALWVVGSSLLALSGASSAKLIFFWIF